MAVTINDLQAITKDKFNGKVTQIIYETNNFLDLINKRGNAKKTLNGGYQLKLPVRYTELDQAKSVDPDDARSTVRVETRTDLVFDPKFYICDIVATWNEQSKCKSEHAVVNLLKEKLAEGLEDLSAKVSEHLFQAYANIGSNDLRGIYDFIRDPSTSTTYAELSSSDSSDHVAGLYDTTTTVLSLYGSNSMDYAIRQCSFREPPTHIFTTRAIASIYSSKLQPGERRQPQTGKGGSGWDSDLYFQGIPIIADANITSGHMIFLNMNSLYFFVYPDDDFKGDGWERDPDRLKADRNLLTLVCVFATDCRKQHGAFTGITS